ncbi:hypothetical protein THAOC_16538 [Thalassiosira oceanica]|uniref:Uncharacterized protein n=1 Tax=Thalassiosira oceanica TaxID=159749 RepID=K0SD20_THAOC|nr:hypothetical protein THAOC_16538 [Thalassiosira oceanica]|eukprot:EJK62834.1 hypothetical protein THAOC_16538 [Thalassiosira oceanica]
MNTDETVRLCIGAAADGPHDDAVSRLKQQVDSMEATFQREILDMKRAGADLLEKNKSIESQLSSLREETEKLKAKVSQLDEESLRLEAAFKLHANNIDWKYDAADPPSDSYWIEQGYDYRDIEFINEDFFRLVKVQSEKLRRGTFGLNDGDEELSFGTLSIHWD